MTNDTVFIGGTWAGHLDEEEVHWWEYWKKGTFAKEFADRSHTNGYAFQWSGELKAFRWCWSKPWKEAAKKLIAELEEAMIYTPTIVAHSHGGNVALHALDMGLECDHLITLATPPRAGVPAYRGKWTNVVGTRDWVVRAGMLMDGRVSTKTTHKTALNLVVKGATHASVHNCDTWEKNHIWLRAGIPNHPQSSR